ncbi:hypothetical protein HK405_011897, partial [Cladochytrium tenue]
PERPCCAASLREREDVLAVHGTTPETAEQSYRIRMQLRGVREAAGRMRKLADKGERRLRRAVERDQTGEPPATGAAPSVPTASPAIRQYLLEIHNATLRLR